MLKVEKSNFSLVLARLHALSDISNLVSCFSEFFNYGRLAGGKFVAHCF